MFGVLMGIFRKPYKKDVRLHDIFDYGSKSEDYAVRLKLKQCRKQNGERAFIRVTEEFVGQPDEIMSAIERKYPYFFKTNPRGDVYRDDAALTLELPAEDQPVCRERGWIPKFEGTLELKEMERTYRAPLSA